MPPTSAPKSDSKPLPPAELPQKAGPVLTGSLPLLRAAWIALFVWILMLVALALHVLEVW